VAAFGDDAISGNVEPKFDFMDNEIYIYEKFRFPKKCIAVEHLGKSKSIHMASSGYFIRQNIEMPDSPKIVKIVREG